MARARKRVSHVKEIYYIVSILVLVAATVVTIWGPGGFLEVKREQIQLEMRRAKVDALRKSNQQRLDRVQSLRSNPQALESYTREKGYSRSGEIIQQLPQQSPAPAAPESRPK